MSIEEAPRQDPSEATRSVAQLPQSAVAASASPELAAAPRRNWRQRVLRGVRWAALTVVVWLTVVLTTMVLYNWINPPFTSLTVAAYLTGEQVDQRWIPLARISPNLVRAVIASEDSGFCSHRGVSISELEQAMERALEGMPRGASTISMQVVKNLWLWPHRSYLRKAIEVPLTLLMELVMSKRRIIEIYLNIAEWGPGIYGAEAAARHHYGKSATRLTEAEAALLAVTLPNPYARDPRRPGPGLQRVGRIIETRMRALPRSVACLGLGS